MIDFTITDDTLTDYLNELEKHFQAHKELLNYEFARSIVGNYGSTGGKIAHLMSTDFNPYLYTSGQDESFWKKTVDEGISIIEIMYSGMHLHEQYPVGKARVWWEFGKYARGGRNDVLERDYAWYQETGEDKIAKPQDAKHTGAIQTGLASANSNDLKQTAHYMESIMKLWSLTNPPMGGRR